MSDLCMAKGNFKKGAKTKAEWVSSQKRVPMGNMHGNAASASFTLGIDDICSGTQSSEICIQNPTNLCSERKFCDRICSKKKESRDGVAV